LRAIHFSPFAVHVANTIDRKAATYNYASQISLL